MQEEAADSDESGTISAYRSGRIHPLDM
jgi:hypothetical protein